MTVVFRKAVRSLAVTMLRQSWCSQHARLMLHGQVGHFLRSAAQTCPHFERSMNLEPRRPMSLSSEDPTTCKTLDILRHVDTESTCCIDLVRSGDMVVINDFVSETEEMSILKEINPYMARLRYEYSHWDDAIHGYRETERSSWTEENAGIIQRVKDYAFSGVEKPTDFVHVLDLEADGEIKPHKDSIRYCGDTIAGLSLLSDSVMRLTSTDSNSPAVMDILLSRRSLYIMRNAARYDFTHEILHNSRSLFKGKPITKGRRISVICRNNPSSIPEDS